MAECILSVVGIAVITLLCDVILPDGQTRKYIKTVLGIVVTFVIAQSILGLFAQDVNTDFSADGEVKVQSQYVLSVTDRRNAKLADELKATLRAQGYDADKVSASAYENSVSVEIVGGSRDSAAVKSIVGKFFPEYEIVIIWK